MDTSTALFVATANIAVHWTFVTHSRKSAVQTPYRTNTTSYILTQTERPRIFDPLQATAKPLHTCFDCHQRYLTGKQVDSEERGRRSYYQPLAATKNIAGETFFLVVTGLRLIRRAAIISRITFHAALEYHDRTARRICLGVRTSICNLIAHLGQERANIPADCEARFSFGIT